jgi:hypothetical protein
MNIYRHYGVAMRVRHFLSLGAVALLVGCTSGPQPVMSLGNDVYSVADNAGLKPASWVEIKTAALDRANKYCAFIGERLTHPKIESNHATGLRPKEATVTFTCEPLRPAAPAKNAS